MKIFLKKVILFIQENQRAKKIKQIKRNKSNTKTR